MRTKLITYIPSHQKAHILLTGLLLTLFLGIVTACTDNIASLSGQSMQAQSGESTVSLNAVNHIQVCNKAGNVVVRTDSSASEIMVKSQKEAYTKKDAEQAEIDSRLQSLVVKTQDASSSACDWLTQADDSSTLTVTAQSPDDQNLMKPLRDRINLEIIVPAKLVVQSGLKVNIEGFDQVKVNGIGGNLQITSLSGDVTIEKSFLDQDSRLYTASGELHFSGELRGGNKHEITSDSGDVTLTFPASTNAKLEATAPTGSISSDFALKGVEESVAGESFSGELNPDAGNAASTALKIHAGDGAINLRKL